MVYSKETIFLSHAATGIDDLGALAPVVRAVHSGGSTSGSWNQDTLILISAAEISLFLNTEGKLNRGRLIARRSDCVLNGGVASCALGFVFRA